MRLTLSRTVCVLLLAGAAAALLPAEAHAYINAGFKSREEYDRYLKGRGIDELAAALRIWWYDADDYLAYGRGSADQGNWDLAIKNYSKALAMGTTDRVKAYVGRGDAWWEKKDHARALADYEAAARRDRDDWGEPGVDTSPYLRLAAAYAGCPDPKRHDPAKAIAMARKACEVAERRCRDKDGFFHTLGDVHSHAECLQVLAALHAHAGEFGAAISWQARAVKLLGREQALDVCRADDPEVSIEDVWDDELDKLEQAAKRRLEHYRRGRTVWDFPRHLTGPANPRLTKVER
jgi:tetratricopeptide (TPR) repeat protein